MESPPRRGPPPPSEPPPRDITRSGRVPPPKGAPPGGARRARPSNLRQADLLALKAKPSKGGKRDADGQEGGSKREFHRRTPSRGPPQSDEESPSDTPSPDSSEGNIVSEHRRGGRALHAVSRRQDGHFPSPGLTRDRTENPSDSDSSGASSSNRSGKMVRHPRSESRSRGTGHVVESPGSTNSWSSDDNAFDDRDIVKRRRRKGSDHLIEGGRREDPDRERNSGRRRHDDNGRSSSDDSRQNRATSNLDSNNVGERDSGRRDNRNQHTQPTKNMQTPRKGDFEDGSSSDEDKHFPHALGTDSADKRRCSDTFAGGNPHYRTRDHRKRLETRSKSEGRNERNHGRRSRAEDDSDAEGYEWSSNKDTWDAGSTSDDPKSPVVTRRYDDAARQKPTDFLDTDTEDNTTRKGDDTMGARRSSTWSENPDKELRESPVQEIGREDKAHGRPATRSDTNPVKRSERSVGDHQSSQSSGTKLATPQPQNVGKSPGATVGKPIRGARWGEAIGVRSRVIDTTTIPTTKVDLKRFVSLPLRSGPGTVLRCFIERDRGGTHKFSHVYSLYADLEDGSGRLLLAARKLLASKTAYYVICLRQDDLFRESGKRGGNSFLAKLRASSTAHTEYALYDRGDNPTSASTETKNDPSRESISTSVRNPADAARAETTDGQENVQVRKELGVIVYNFDKKEQRAGKRRMEVAIPQIHQAGDSFEPVSWQPSDIKDGMKPNFGRIRYQGAQNFLQDDRLLIFHQRESRYDPLSSCLVDFRGRATAPSVKNFQLLKSPPENNVKRARYFSEGAGKDDCESDDVPRSVCLQMGKVGKDCFNVDVEWPLSLLQAFAICLSRFDTNAQF